MGCRAPTSSSALTPGRMRAAPPSWNCRTDSFTGKAGMSLNGRVPVLFQQGRGSGMPKRDGEAHGGRGNPNPTRESTKEPSVPPKGGSRGRGHASGGVYGERGRCWECGKAGHVRRDCPQLGAMEQSNGGGRRNPPHTTGRFPPSTAPSGGQGNE
jgi:hypothetical protein